MAQVNIQAQPTEVKQGLGKSNYWIVAAFLLPVLLAYLSLQIGWFERGATNKGELLTPVRQHQLSLPENIQGKWLLLYQQPLDCQQSCKNAEYLMAQVKLAVGREMDRVDALLIAPQFNHAAPDKLQQLISSADFSFNQDKPDAIYLADPLGNVMLRYSIGEDKQQSLLKAKEMLIDLKKLLKLSRIG